MAKKTKRLNELTKSKRDMVRALVYTMQEYPDYTSYTTEEISRTFGVSKMTIAAIKANAYRD